MLRGVVGMLPGIAWTSDVDYRYEQPTGFKAKPYVSGQSCDVTLGVTGAQTTTYYEGDTRE